MNECSFLLKLTELSLAEEIILVSVSSEFFAQEVVYIRDGKDQETPIIRPHKA